MHTDLIQNEVEAEGLTAPRVTKADVEAKIASEHYFTAAQGMRAAFFEDGGLPARDLKHAPLERLTICVLVLKNGFTVTGESTCVSPENFDKEIGRKIARQKAVDKVWPLLGFALIDAIYEGRTTVKES